jgi:hypothetical protein
MLPTEILNTKSAITYPYPPNTAFPIKGEIRAIPVINDKDEKFKSGTVDQKEWNGSFTSPMISWNTNTINSSKPAISHRLTQLNQYSHNPLQSLVQDL